MPENTNTTEIKLYFTNYYKIEGLFKQIICSNIPQKFTKDNFNDVFTKFLNNNYQITTFNDLINAINAIENKEEIIELTNFGEDNPFLYYLKDNGFKLGIYKYEIYNSCQFAFIFDNFNDKNPYELSEKNKISIIYHNETNNNIVNAIETQKIRKTKSHHEVLNNGSESAYTTRILSIINYFNNLKK
jgi:hypothetical protein